jgi:pimeloyl-ACP methyl ester carboxylesterase
MPHLKMNDIRIYYEVQGQGTSLLVIPGLPMVVSDFAPLVDQLSEDFTVITYDNRGAGQSDKPDETYTTALMAQDAAALLDNLGIEKAHVFGFSMGGMIAQELALGFGHRVMKLVLGGTHSGMNHAVPPSAEVAQAFSLVTSDWSERIRALAPFAFSADYYERHPEAVESFIVEKSADVQPEFAYLRQLGAVVRHDAHDRLPRISHPTLILMGANDPAVPVENGRMLARLIPNAKLAEVDGGHLFIVE